MNRKLLGQRKYKTVGLPTPGGPRLLMKWGGGSNLERNPLFYEWSESFKIDVVISKQSKPKVRT